MWDCKKVCGGKGKMVDVFIRSGRGCSYGGWSRDVNVNGFWLVNWGGIFGLLVMLIVDGVMVLNDIIGC